MQAIYQVVEDDEEIKKTREVVKEGVDRVANLLHTDYLVTWDE